MIIRGEFLDTLISIDHSLKILSGRMPEEAPAPAPATDPASSPETRKTATETGRSRIEEMKKRRGVK